MTSLLTYARDAVGNLLGAMQRSLLALIGIVIGIGSVIALLTIGGIAQNEAAKQFEALGTDILSVINVTPPSRSASGLQNTLDVGDAAQLMRLPSVLSAAPYTSDSGELSMGEETRRVTVIGATPAFAEMYNLQMAKGRFVSHFDGLNRFAVMGAGIAEAMQDAGSTPELGMRLRVDENIFTLIGVLDKGFQRPAGVRLDESLVLPIRLAQRELATEEVWGISVLKVSDVHYLTTTAEIQGHFARSAPKMTVRVDSPIWLIRQMEQQMRMFALLLGTVGGISLVMGGFGVMNAMLASVAERRLEVGIRRALGARQGDIQNQFLAESSVLCLAGGVLGAVLGVGSAFAISNFLDWAWQLSVLAMVIGIGTACGVGLFFGFYPARQAARLDPISTIRDG